MPPFPPCEAVIPMSAQEYLVERDNAAFRGLLAEIMQLGEVEVVETWRDSDIRYEKEVQKPDYDRWVPKIGRKFIKNRGDLDFYDIIRYDPDLLDKPPYQLPVSSSFPLLGPKLQVERKVIIEAIDDNHCRHRVEGEVHSDAHFGIGKLAEHMVIDSTAKTVERLPEITERYLEVRREMMKSPEGRRALLEGVPDVVIEVAELEHILQKPYEEAQPQMQVQEQLPPQETLDTGPVVQEADVAAAKQETKTGEVLVKPPSPRTSTEMIHDVEMVPGKDAEWDCVCEAWSPATGDTAANRATVVALEGDREEALRHLHRLSPSKVEKVVLKDLKHSHLLSRHERKAVKELLEDEKHRERRNDNVKNWRKFWRKCNPATCPVGNEAARVVQLVHLGNTVGVVELDEKGEVKAVVAEAEPAPQAATTSKEHKEKRGGIKKVFDRLHLSKRHEE